MFHTINGAKTVGFPHHEVAAELKGIDVGTEFNITFIEPKKREEYSLSP